MTFITFADCLFYVVVISLHAPFPMVLFIRLLHRSFTLVAHTLGSEAIYLLTKVNPWSCPMTNKWKCKGWKKGRGGRVRKLEMVVVGRIETGIEKGIRMEIDKEI